MLARSSEGAGRELRRARLGRSMPPQASVVALCRADTTPCLHRGLSAPHAPAPLPASRMLYSPQTNTIDKFCFNSFIYLFILHIILRM